MRSNAFEAPNAEVDAMGRDYSRNGGSDEKSARQKKRRHCLAASGALAQQVISGF
jgi:hypothetical protein